ncbi:phosphatase PAP2 family protein [Nocardioides sp. DS6]|uniref:Phosphatase PAP2 family protein n=1 Tax=Nocardioides eburneus TaxID=3231482 RepID=A0ABV3SWN4_9ACTN
MPDQSVETRRPRVVVWQQVVLGLVVFGYYLVVDSLHSPGRRAAADRHGLDIARLEDWLHLDVEKWLNDWLAGHHTLMVIANYEYAFTYILSAIATLAYLVWRHPEVWRRARTSFVIVTVVGITCFGLYPTTPPRMLPGNAFFDTVANHHTWGSWGSPLVSGANELAAMPSLHMGWALWVSVALLWAGVPRWVQWLSALHVTVTLVVILATANHYLLDAVAAFVLVVLADRVALWIHPYWEGSLVPSADAFFLHVEETGHPQIVGGLVFWDPAQRQPVRQDLVDLVASELGSLPRFSQRIEQRGRWRRARWVVAPPLDWDWHVVEWQVPGRRGVDEAVARIAAEPFPRDRPLWRIVILDMGDGSKALLFLLHHAIADGIGTVLQAMQILRPRISLPEPAYRPSGLQTAAATALGFAQLATDGSKPGGKHAGLGVAGQDRDFATGGLPLAELKEASRPHRVTDLVLALTAGAVAESHPELVAASAGRIRVAVPLMVREPGAAAEGNATAAVMVDVPLRADDTGALMDEIATVTARLRRPTRALASRWVMAHLLRIFPEPCVGWFARTVYGHRFFDGIVSNMPGPTQQLSMAGSDLVEVYPILPLAPGAPFVVGALSWDGVLGVGLATDPGLVDARAVTTAMERRLCARLAQLREAQGRGSSYDDASGAVV